MGAFYYGYCISQIPGGRLAEMYSGKWVFGLGTVITAILTLLTPLAARYHVGVLIAIRALEGLAQGVTMPAMHSMLGRWMPDSERGLLSTIVYTGINIGTVAFMPLSGALCQSDWFGGWPSAFYVIGIMGCCWFFLWCVLVTDTPHTHPFISQRELKYIISNQKIDQYSKLPPIPWKKIFTSAPFIALVVTQIGQDWCFYTIINDLPTYLSTILHFNIEKSGFMSSAPQLLQCAVALLMASVADYVVRKGIASTNFVRKFWNSMSGFGYTLGLIGVCLSGCNSTMNVAFFMLSIAVGGFAYCGYMLSHLDLSPEYAGTLMGVSNTISNLTGFLAPLVVGALTEKYQTLHQWHIVFIIAGIVLTFSTFTFIFFASTKKQDWAQQNLYEGLNSSEESPRQKKEYGTILK